MYTSFGDRILLLRKKNKLTQEQLAQKIGISVKELADYEGDVAFPPFNVAVKIADVLDVSLDFLACRIDQPIEARFLQRVIDIQNMSDEHMNMTVDVMDMLIRDDKRMKINKQHIS